MDIRPIRNDADYRSALDEIDAIFQAAPGTPEGDRLDVLATLVEAWERVHTPIDPPDVVTAIEFAMEQKGLTRDDLAKILGAQSRVSEILRRRRPVTLAMARRLHDKLGIPADCLLREYELEPAGSG